MLKKHLYTDLYTEKSAEQESEDLVSPKWAREGGKNWGIGIDM